MSNKVLLEQESSLNIDYKDENLNMLYPKTVMDLFEIQVRLTPQKTGVITENGNLTFKELDDQSNLVSQALIAKGVTQESCVGIYVEPSIDMMVGTFGILKAGCSYLPLAPEYPEDRIRYMIEDSGLKIIFTQSIFLKTLKNLGLKDVIFLTIESLATNSEINEEKQFTDTESLAYVIYTSGTTGRPKGVEIQHKSIVNQLLWLNTVYQINSQQIILRKTPMSFDAAQWELLSVVLGATVVMAAPGAYRDPFALIETIKKHNVTVLQCVPTLLQALISEPEFTECNSLNYIFSGGEALTRKLARSCLNIMPETILVNLYGPTECTINSSALTVTSEYLDKSPKVVSIGFPVSNTHYYILDQENRSLVEDFNTIGELYISGLQVARSYLAKPEQTAETFITININQETVRAYKTGDLVSKNTDGTIQFIGRADNQIKLRGHRIELDEIRVAVENHDWVKSAAVFVNKDDDTHIENLVACIELNPREAILMDQGDHHLSKTSRTQVKAQLSQLGIRHTNNLDNLTIPLSGKQANQKQHSRAFARKSYRFYEGDEISQKCITDLLNFEIKNKNLIGTQQISLDLLGEILRNLGPFYSEERLLPKYAYASPGALYANQMYLQIEGLNGIEAGIYYFNPLSHELIQISKLTMNSNFEKITVHLVGKESAIEAVYKNNVIEVLEMEAGHLLGLLDNVLPEYGLGVGTGFLAPEIMDTLYCGAGHKYLGSYPLIQYEHIDNYSNLDFFVQADTVSDLPKGLYHYDQGKLKKNSEDVIQKKHVIAINQRTYEQASFGVAIVKLNESKWDDYIQFGRSLQTLQMNDQRIGLMSSGYSSKTGNDLATAKRLEHLLSQSGLKHHASYFALAGGVSEKQLLNECMKEDSIHAKGPSEILKQDLENILPTYMVPSQIVILDEIPLTANGKVNVEQLKANIKYVQLKRDIVLPRNTIENKIADIWRKVMEIEEISILDDFFEIGGDSLSAVSIIHFINKSLNIKLPLQTIFSNSTIESLAIKVDETTQNQTSRLVNLNNGKYLKRPIYCWPGLGGYPMNLRSLAFKIGRNRSFLGIQAFGINDGEEPYSSIADMAKNDVAMLKQHQPHGPYTLWGYSFGARVAFEVAYQLEAMGDIVDNLLLIAPGSPKIRTAAFKEDGQYCYSDDAFLSILYSVFAGRLPDNKIAETLEKIDTKAKFIELIIDQLSGLDRGLIQKISNIVELTYEFKYTFTEMLEHKVNAPITIFKAVGDDYSFVEQVIEHLTEKPLVLDILTDHYKILKPDGVDEIIDLIEEIEVFKNQKNKLA
ncbi:hypothetical protein AMD27_12430 [Acinetobacter sp. TGL-Y2]|uniref:amino acid adenylation domain-containing protein n=1 Tax=Acinetobacter sp. TGL-Y2 TaxID=1407071 RepID=UPI0007A65E9C|nr:amino acid adenylation domain-containing protein [Acinetobacter sp. TGL-Y2]AMW79615.1 hypothetical protein AMD27_12430 [Acinetobacter sp. TGL-Y2]